MTKLAFRRLFYYSNRLKVKNYDRKGQKTKQRRRQTHS
jgi:hypothetical protein